MRFLAHIRNAVFAFAVTTVATLAQDFNADCHALTKHPHRLSGTKEYAEAADYVYGRLQALQPDDLFEQPFASTQTETISATMQIKDGALLELMPMRPNGIIPPVTPEGGVTGPIVHIGKGTANDFDKVPVENCIVVLDYNCGQGWVRALRLGAVAVVFTKPDLAEARNPHFADANVNLLRYYYNGNPADLPKDGTTVTIKSSVRWVPTIGRNIFALFKGTDPVFSQKKDEIIILAANLDSFGEIPTLSPGARSAASCAALLRIAENIAKYRPRRHVLVAFFDNQARGHQGSSIFYRAIENDKQDFKVETRLESHKWETAFIGEMRELLAQPDPLTAQAPNVRRRLLDRLADKAQNSAHVYKDQEYRMNDEVMGYRKQYGQNIPPKIQARITEINGTFDENGKQLKPGLLAKASETKHTWNELQRVIGHQKRDIRGGKPVTLEPEVKKNLDEIMDQVRADIEARANELELEKKSLEADKKIYDLFSDKWVTMHASILLGGTTDKWALIIGGESSMHSWQDNPGLYGKIQTSFLNLHKAREAKGLANRFLLESANQTLSLTRVIWGSVTFVHSGEPAGMFGIYNLAFGTVQEATSREGTPDDTLANINLNNVIAQADDIAAALCPIPSVSDGIAEDLIGNQTGLSLKRNIVVNKEYVIPSFTDDYTVKGPMVMGMLQGTSIPNTPMRGATVQFRLSRSFSLAYNENKHLAFDNFQVLRTNSNGVYSLGPIAGSWGARGGFAVIFNKNGGIAEVSDQSSYPNVKWRLNTFKANSAAVILPSQQRTDKLPGEDVKILSARANADLVANKSFSETVDGVVTWYSEEREKGVKLFSLRQMVGLNNGPAYLDGKSHADEQIGEGFPMDGSHLAINAAARSSADLWRLNDSRMEILESKGILDSSLAEMHGRAEDILLEAAKPETTPQRRESLNTIAFWASRPVYNKVRAMLDDLVFAVLILLGLSVPFAFALERVIIGATTIYKQIYWFASFFALTFLILYFSHPAFAIANTPIIIFLGFAIVVMSSMVIFIIMRKFEVELKAIQGMTATVHVNDVSSISTFMAAMQMGISTMRRRPTRTALTAITIILLTFTILCFASFGTQNGIVTIFVAPNPTYSGTFVHNVNWNPLSEDLRDVIKGCWPEMNICRRLWISPKTQDNPGLLVSRIDATKPNTVRGILGVEPQELEFRADLKEYFGSIDDNTVLITEALANALDVKPGDKILVKGRQFTVGKLLDAVQLSAAKDMDTSSILPADFTETTSSQGSASAEADDEEMEMMSQRNWASLPVDQVAILSADTAKTLGAGLYALQIYTKDPAEAIITAENLARMIPFPIPATRNNGVYRHLQGTVLKASGARDLFFPIVLGGLVIFGTMLGSVADRKKEIYTFSALGLAPKHVATLFFAESMVYALIGGLGGYLLAQGTLKLLGIASEYGLVRVPEMNMSSTNTIVTILIVMATVLISSIYPAIKASKSANPGLMRIWRPPEPKGDVLDLVFPFTVSQYDITGVVAFLQEHFGNHTDTGLGRFMTSEVALVKDNDGLGLNAGLALAPFDLGVSQKFALRSTPSEIPGIDEVRVILKRVSGQPKDWQRLNKVFLDDLRQQFLIWRSIPRETMEHYRQITLQTFAEEDKQETPKNA